MNNILLILQLIIPVLLAILILLQQRGSAVGAAFGGESGGFYTKRRGLDKKIFAATIILGALFILVSFLNVAF